MRKYLNIMDQEIDTAIIRKEKAMAEWLANIANMNKFLELHAAQMAYRAVMEKWLSINIVKN